MGTTDQKRVIIMAGVNTGPAIEMANRLGQSGVESLLLVDPMTYDPTLTEVAGHKMEWPILPVDTIEFGSYATVAPWIVSEWGGCVDGVIHMPAFAPTMVKGRELVATNPSDVLMAFHEATLSYASLVSMAAPFMSGGGDVLTIVRNKAEDPWHEVAWRALEVLTVAYSEELYSRGIYCNAIKVGDGPCGPDLDVFDVCAEIIEQNVTMMRGLVVDASMLAKVA